MRDVERERAKELFGTVDAPNALATRIMGIKSHGAGTFETGADTSRTTATSKSYRVKLTDKEKKRVEKLIRNATSLQEISRLEKELNEGRIPGGVGGVSDEDD